MMESEPIPISLSITVAISLFLIAAITSDLTRTSEVPYHDDSLTWAIKLAKQSSVEAIERDSPQSLHSADAPMQVQVEWEQADAKEEKVTSINRTTLENPQLTQRLYVLSAKREGGGGTGSSDKSRSVKGLFCAIDGICKTEMLRHLRTSHLQVHKLDLFAVRDRERILSHMRTSSVFRFALVQHPMVRSWHLFHRLALNASSHPVEYARFMARLRRAPFHPTDRELHVVSYRMFLALLKHRRQTLRDEHVDLTDETDDVFEDQCKICSIPLVRYAFLGRVESLSRVLHVIDQRLNIRVSSSLQCSDVQSPHNVSAFRDVTVMHRAHRLFRADLDRLRYRADPPPAFL